MKTDFETLTSLAAYIVGHLKEDGLIEFPIDKRLDLIDSLATELGVSFATDEDIRQQAIEEVEEKMGEENLPEEITESEIYNQARKEIIKSFQGENIGGLFLMESLHQIAIRVKDFMMESDYIDDVFGTDDELIAFLVNRIRNFSMKRG